MPLHHAASLRRLFITCLVLLSFVWIPPVSGGYVSGAGPSYCLNGALIPLVDAPQICLLGGDVNLLDFGGGFLSVDLYPENGDKGGPWTHRPVCIESDTASLEEDETEEEEEFCIFTNTTFNHGKGVSIFTTPSIAQEFSELPAFQSGSSDSRTDGKRNHVWYTKFLPGRGAGMLAKKKLGQGELILESRPVLVVNPKRKMGRRFGEEVLGRAVDQLRGVTRGRYLGLARGTGDESVRVQDVLK